MAISTYEMYKAGHIQFNNERLLEEQNELQV